MTATDTTALVLAVAAIVVAIGAVIVMWRRGRRRRRAVRSRHPSARPPLSVRTVEITGGRRLRIDVPRTAAETAIDIVSFQRVGAAADDWESEPLVEPLVIQPGGFVILTSPLPGDGAAFDVVVAWTAHHPIGPVQGSLLFRLPRERDRRTSVAQFGPSLQLGSALALLILLVLAAVPIFAEFVSDDDGEPEPPDDTTAMVESPTSSAAPSSPAIVATTDVTDAPPTSTVTTTEPTTATPTTTSTTSTTSTTTTSTPTTTSTTTSSTTIPALPRVLAEASVGACRFGPDCLMVGFTIEGFDERPPEFVCEFGDGSRYTFELIDDTVEVACSSSSADPEITIEVAGVRSATLTRADA